MKKFEEILLGLPGIIVTGLTWAEVWSVIIGLIVAIPTGVYYWILIYGKLKEMKAKKGTIEK
jgi:O-antigen/teichoic acid export membrane protein